MPSNGHSDGVSVWQPARELSSRAYCSTLGRDDFSERPSRRLRDLTGARSVAWLQQVHGTDVVCVNADRTDVTSASNPAFDNWPTADAMWTQEPGVLLALLTADCLPVVIADVAGNCIGVAHAGWRGLFAGVIETLIDAVPVPAGRLRAWCGPAISAASYEVGPDVAVATQALGLPLRVEAKVLRSHPSTDGKFLLDLKCLLGWKLRQCGVESVQTSGVCSLLEPNCHSFRRDGGARRMVTIAQLHPRQPENSVRDED